MLAILFAALTLAAGGVHEHDRTDGGATKSAIAAATHAAALPAACPLCQWATASYALPAPCPVLTAPRELPTASPSVTGDASLVSLPVLHRNLRAPPSSEIA